MKDTSHTHNYIIDDEAIAKNERKTAIVVIITAIMMVTEILAGFLTGSMALLADGWHMASHAGALFISFLAYRFAKSQQFNENFTFGGGKLIPLGGYTSAIGLAIVALIMASESVQRLFNPGDIHFKQAIFVAVIGLITNVLCAFILMDKDSHHHHGHEHHHPDDHIHKHTHDHNLHSAYIHVIADALTSILAIIALITGLFLNQIWLDPVMGIVGSVVIMKWAYNLCRDTGWELLDGHAKSVNHDQVRDLFEKDGAIVQDMHIWRIAPKALACEVSVDTPNPIDVDGYKKILKEKFEVKHINIETLVNSKKI